MGCRVLFVRVCRGHQEHAALGTWTMRAVRQAEKDPRISYVNEMVADECPTDVCRNKIALIARRLKIDYLFSTDHDNVPHANWFSSSLDYLIANPLSVVAAPYVGCRPQHEGAKDRPIHVMIPDDKVGYRHVTRAEAMAGLTGFQPVSGVATLLAIDMKIFEKLSLPWWAYEYHDEHHSEAGSEDYWFSKRCTDAGINLVVNWDCPAIHHKSEGLALWDKRDEELAKR